MSLRSMEIYCAVVELEKMTLAADKLGMSSAAISKAIKELENSLNTQLLIRTTRTMCLTVEGKAYYENAKLILSEVQGLNSMFIENSRNPAGKLKIVAPLSFGLTNFGSVISEFQRIFPDIQLQIDFEDKISALNEKGYDLAVRISEKLNDSTLKARLFSSFTHHLVVHKDLIKEFGPIKSHEDLRKFPCIAYSYHKNPTVWNLKTRSEDIKFEFKSKLTVNSSLFILDQVKNGAGIALLPSFMLRHIHKDKNIVEILDGYQKKIVSGWVVVVRTGHMRVVERAFIDLLVKYFC